MDMPDDFLRILTDNSMHFRGEVVLQCAGCGRPLLDRVMLKSKGRLWHADCLRCVECSMPLTEKCYERNDLNFCEEHFYRKFGTRCDGCDHGILPLETVRRVRHLVFHLQCFVCLVCQRELVTGDHFYLVDDKKLICQEDYAANSGRESILTERSVKRFLVLPSVEKAGGGGKRPRTSISSSQLDALKSAYRRSPKPSRSVREQLAAETGLDMRVVQVWFQNRRAKEKRLKKEIKKPPWDRKIQINSDSCAEEIDNSSNICLSASDFRFAFLQQIIYFTKYEQKEDLSFIQSYPEFE